MSMWVDWVVATVGRPTRRPQMVVSRSVQFVEEIKKLMVHPKYAIDRQSLMVNKL